MRMMIIGGILVVAGWGFHPVITAIGLTLILLGLTRIGDGH